MVMRYKRESHYWKSTVTLTGFISLETLLISIVKVQWKLQAFFFFFLGSRGLTVSQANLNSWAQVILLFQPPGSWGYRHTSLHWLVTKIWWLIKIFSPSLILLVIKCLSANKIQEFGLMCMAMWFTKSLCYCALFFLNLFPNYFPNSLRKEEGGEQEGCLGCKLVLKFGISHMKSEKVCWLFLRQGFTVQCRLALTLLCGPGWPWFSCLGLPGAGI